MVQSFNQDNTSCPECGRREQRRRRPFKFAAWLSLSLLCATAFGQSLQPGLEAQLESLAAAYRAEENSNNQANLLAFCRRNAATPQGTLGFFLLGYRAFEDRRLPEAKKYLQQSSRPATLIPDYVGYYAAAAAFELKEFKECQDHLADFPSRFPNSALLTKARLLFWQSSLELKDGQAVLNSIKGVANRESNPDALFYEAQSHELLGDAAEALAAYQKLHYQFPLYASAAKVSQNLAALEGTGVSVSKEWRTGRIEKLLEGRKHREALKDLELLFAADPQAASQDQQQLWLGLSQFGTRQYYAAIQTLKPLRNAPFEVAAQALFTVAECYRKLDNYGRFKQTALDMEAGFARSRWWEEALFSLGNYNLVRRDLDESLAFYQKSVDQFPNGARVKDSHWRIAWYSYRAGRVEHALELFVDHLLRFRDSEHRAAALYWAGRAQLRLGKAAQARQVFEGVVQRFPTQYYGQLARAQLATGSAPARVAYGPDSRLETVLADLKTSAGAFASQDLTFIRKASLNDWPRVRALSQLNLFELAAKELQHRPAYGSSRSIDFHSAQLLIKAKNFHQSTVLLRKVFPNYLDIPFNSLPREIWEMFYPVHYEDIIRREAAKYAIDPFLVMALIRQESAFNPKAVSVANAHGLMQLLPSTARRLARGMKLPRPSAARLHEPEVNIRFGMRYLSDLLKQFSGQTEKALASYNAGEHRVESWMSEGPYADSAEFVDTIPFSETRNYVKIIQRNYFFYKALYSGQ
jgi:soluble lytic murein transglycosylase